MDCIFESQLYAYQDSRVYSRHLVIPPEKADPFVKKGNLRVLCTINNSLTFHAAILPKKSEFHILMNKANCDNLNLQLGDVVLVSLTEDNSEYGMPMPQEIEYLLKDQPSFKNHFDALTPGKKRNLLYLVNKVKNLESRLNKAMAICDHLIEENGKLDFKILNEKIKKYNNAHKLKR